MKHYDFAVRFRAVYENAHERYSQGKRTAAGIVTDDEKAWLAANGISAQHLFDYAEDESNYGEPGADRALTIENVRRDYFINAQGGRASGKTLDETKLPGKTDAVNGIEWLPRLIPKARAKLRGELPPSIMYCCGGDRRFFTQHRIDPAEFLSLVWRNEGNDKAIVDWVVQRSSS